MFSHGGGDPISICGCSMYLHFALVVPCLLQPLLVQALKAANVQMKGAMKANKELDLSFIDNLQVCD